MIKVLIALTLIASRILQVGPKVTNFRTFGIHVHVVQDKARTFRTKAF